MSTFSSVLRPTLFSTLCNAIFLGGATYHLSTRIDRNLEEQEARLDEIEGTLRGHIGLIEDALDRIEGKANRGRQEELYGKRGRDEKEQKGKKE
ncbi:uncharacterized protein CC84DRAFT_1166771 [Paraphaeosphaeria sporulosa]|uniref:Uncharacterized protein n=1 Tax=Paraphaeosphaeria sporulosa TaxID=1460663 RepID=A0A177C6F6_9PLEO|nr:uncharacterized protein CC84DRAFT_1166771 [Paraphaeosphaeria sporulosa]OAG02986.1 hypothetical protein CC84DRAFT_1166771 [Paraphaeosphaeria sporulosa]